MPGGVSLVLLLSFSPTELLVAASNLSSSSTTGPDKVAYPMLKHLSRSGMDFLLHIFNLSWTLHSFPSICKTSSIIPIHKMGNPLDSSASFRPISLTSCVSKLFERIILSRPLFFLESNSVFSPRPGRSTLDQILYLSQSILDGFNKPRPGSRTILSTIDFSKAFDSVWHPVLFRKLISFSLSACFARWTQSFLSDRRAFVVYQNHKSRSFRVRRGVAQESVLGPVPFSLLINDLLAPLPSSVSCSLYADDLAVKRAADGRRQRGRKSIDEEREKVLGQERILAKHLDGLERNGFCDFDKPQKRAYQKGKIESNEQSKEGGQPKSVVEKGRMPDRVKSFRKINSRQDRPRARPGFVKPIRNGLRKVQNLIKCRPSRAETSLARRENGITLQKKE